MRQWDEYDSAANFCIPSTRWTFPASPAENQGRLKSAIVAKGPEFAHVNPTGRSVSLTPYTELFFVQFREFAPDWESTDQPTPTT